ncbi:ABC transporter substrate-binding protein [Frondihabitans cladoniiphilus]|uniref:ABC transporter substrate-binding protein n=1 Tax=Frondihabitans cladoniiphilus TaxID=715785 RepID=A0ABP8WE36_9MICO
MKSKTARVGALILTAATAAALLTGCSSGAGGSSGGTIQVETGFASGSDLLATFTKVTNAYEKSHPGVKFNLIPSSTNYEQDLKVKLASHDVPDMWWTHGWSRDRYSKFLEPLQDQSWNKDVNPQLDAAMRTSSGAIYALPLDTDVAGILYNKSVLTKAGVDPESLTSWSAFDAAAAKIKATGVTPIEVSGKANGPAGNLIDWIAPGKYTDAQLASLKAGTFAGSVYKPIVDQVESWRAAGYINPDYSSATQQDMSKALGAGQAAFIFQQNSVAADALTTSPDAQLGFLPVPSDTGKPYLIGGEMNAFGISKTSSHLTELKAFLKYLAQPANDSALAKAAGSAAGLTTSTSDLGALQTSYDQFVVKDKTRLVPYFDRVYLPNGMWNTLVTTTDSVITGQAQPAEAVNQVGTDFKSLYGQNK